MANSTPVTLFAAAQTMTGTTTVVSAPMSLEHTNGYSIQVVWTGTPAGNFTLEASNDLGTDDGAGNITCTNWTTVASSTQAAGGAASSKLYNETCFYRWVRLKYVNASSTGTFNARGYR